LGARPRTSADRLPSRVEAHRGCTACDVAAVREPLPPPVTKHSEADGDAVISPRPVVLVIVVIGEAEPEPAAGGKK